jgi:hypothetical protein
MRRIVHEQMHLVPASTAHAPARELELSCLLSARSALTYFLDAHGIKKYKPECT